MTPALEKETKQHEERDKAARKNKQSDVELKEDSKVGVEDSSQEDCRIEVEEEEYKSNMNIIEEERAPLARN